MANRYEQTALDIMSNAIDILKAQYEVVNGAEARRDQLKAFSNLIFTSMEQLALEADGDGSYITYELPSVIEAIDVAFMDQIEREDEEEPRGQVYSTMNIEQQGLFKPRAGLVKLLNGVK